MASGDSLCFANALNNQPPSTSFATFDIRNNIPVLDFDDTADEVARFGLFMPNHYSGGGVTLTIGWMATSATTGTISLDGAFKSITNDVDDIDSKTFASDNNANPTTSSVSGKVIYTTIDFTDGSDMDSVQAGEYFELRVRRDANGTTSTDNMVGDMELLFIEIKET